MARRWINSMVLSLIEYDEDGEINKATIKPIIDGGTEGFKVPTGSQKQGICTEPANS